VRVLLAHEHAALVPEDQLPVCYVCDMPVQKMYADVYAGHVDLTVECHGDRETVSVPVEIWEGIDPASFRLGPAFGPKLSTSETGA
jgi:hypothetical protein